MDCAISEFQIPAWISLWAFYKVHYADLGSSSDFELLFRPQILLCVAMAKRVSASSVKVTPRRFNSSSVSLQASVFAMAVMEAVNSQEFMGRSPPCYYMDLRLERDGLFPIRSRFGRFIFKGAFFIKNKL